MNLFQITIFSNASLSINARLVSVARKLSYLTIFLVSCFWAQIAFASALSDLANSMQPGTWAPLTTNGFNNGALLRPPAGGSVLEYSDKAGSWNPLNGSVLVLGGSHPNGGPGGLSTVFARYTESSNTWVNDLPNPVPNFDSSFDGIGIGHDYHHDTIHPTTGDYYHRQYYTGRVMKFSHATQSWSQCSVFNPGGAYQVAGALEYFPDRNSLVYLDGDWGVWELSLTSENCRGTWIQRASTTGGGFSPQLTGVFSYHNQSRYSSRCQCIIMGGGNNSRKLYRYNANGTFASVADAPVQIAIPQSGSGTIFTVDPASGLILVWNYSNASTTMYEYNPVTNTWTTISRTSPIFPGPEGGVTETIAIPISTYGVIMFVQASSTSGGTVYLYRHASGFGSPMPPPSDTAAPSVPSRVSAVAASSSQINLSWAPSTDNVAVQGYRIYRDGTQIGIATSTVYSDPNLSPGTRYSYTVAAYDAAGNTSAQSGSASATTQSSVSTLPPTGSADFQARCSQPGVIKCVGFDTLSEIAGTYGDNHGTLPGNSTPMLDSNVKASGNSSLKFTVPSKSGANSSGSYFTNFSESLTTQFGENSDFYIQWRQRFSSEFLSTNYQGGGGWKQAIIGTGDKPGCSASNASSGLCYSSCTALEIVTQNTFHRGFPQMYNSCSGSTSHGPYSPFEQPFGTYDFKLQNARPTPYCLYSQGQTNPKTYFPTAGNCFGYFPNEWMTFQVRIKTGPRVNDEFTNSYVELWVAREGQPSQQVFNWSPYNLSAGSPMQDQKFGKIWLLPYNTGKDPYQSHPTGYVWYDELIISTSRIADPQIGGSTSTPPPAPSSLVIR